MNNTHTRRKKRGVLYSKKLLLTVLTLLILSVAGLILYSYLRVEKITVSGNVTKTSEQIIQSSQIEIGEHIVEVDFKKVVKNINKDPMLNALSVNFVFPSTIEINVEEFTKTAVIKNIDKYIYINENGVVLEMSPTFEKKYIVVQGLSVSGSNIGELIGTRDKHQLQVLLQTIKTLDNPQFKSKIVAIDITNPLDIVLITKKMVHIKIGQAKFITQKLKNALSVLEKMGDVSGGTVYAYGEESLSYSSESSGDTFNIPEETKR